MTPKVWGPPIWNFLHTFSVNISEAGYKAIGMQFYAYITRICRLLPCPECSEHATKYIRSVKPGTLRTKYDMANMLCNFHNMVNARKRLPRFDNRFLSLYEKVSIIASFNNFVQAFTIPSQRMMNDNLHRKMLVTQMNKFLTTNLVYFIKPMPAIPITETLESEPTQSPAIEENVTFEISYSHMPCVRESDFVVDSEDGDVGSVDSRDICISIVDNVEETKEEVLSTLYETKVEDGEEEEILSTLYETNVDAEEDESEDEEEVPSLSCKE